jgi:hypothetical protein
MERRVDLNFGVNDLIIGVCCKIICCRTATALKEGVVDVLVTAQSI